MSLFFFNLGYHKNVKNLCFTKELNKKNAGRKQKKSMKVHITIQPNVTNLHHFVITVWFLYSLAAQKVSTLAPMIIKDIMHVTSNLPLFRYIRRWKMKILKTLTGERERASICGSILL